MPKMKTHSATKKRFKKLGSGKLKRTQAFKRHHAWAKTNKQRRNLCGGSGLSPANEANIARLMPY